jgi:type III pantothenate kinase
MEINLLVLNAGNSRLAIGAFAAGELEHTTRLLHAQRGDWVSVLRHAWMRVAKRSKPAVAAASVNPVLDDPLAHAVREATGQDIHWIGKTIDLPIAVKTQHPELTGVDRVLNIAAAYEQMGKACVVVDAGTCITVDLCNDAGEFLGGAIAPGASMLLNSLHDKTASLPQVALDIPEGAYGKSTEQSILQGVYHGLRGLVKELTENYATELGFWPDIIATGGDAAKLFEGWELIHAIAPDLTLYGIALAYANHHIKHGT